jgi:hypothetical protein
MERSVSKYIIYVYIYIYMCGSGAYFCAGSNSGKGIRKSIRRWLRTPKMDCMGYGTPPFPWSFPATLPIRSPGAVWKAFGNVYNAGPPRYKLHSFTHPTICKYTSRTASDTYL